MRVSFRALFVSIAALGVLLTVSFVIASRTVLFFREFDELEDLRHMTEEVYHVTGRASITALAEELTMSEVDEKSVDMWHAVESQMRLHERIASFAAAFLGHPAIDALLEIGFSRAHVGGDLDYLAYQEFSDGAGGTPIPSRGCIMHLETVHSDALNKTGLSEDQLANALWSHAVDYHEEEVKLIADGASGAALWKRAGGNVTYPTLNLFSPEFAPHVAAAMANRGHTALGWLPYLAHPILVFTTVIPKTSAGPRYGLEDMARPLVWKHGLVDKKPTVLKAGPAAIPGGGAGGAGGMAVITTGLRIRPKKVQISGNTARLFTVQSDGVVGGEWRLMEPNAHDSTTAHIGPNPITGEGSSDLYRQTVRVQDSKDWITRGVWAAIQAHARTAAGGPGGLLDATESPLVAFFRATNGTGNAVLPVEHDGATKHFLVSVQGFARTFWSISAIAEEELMERSRAMWETIESKSQSDDKATYEDSVTRRIIIVVVLLALAMLSAVVSWLVMRVVHRDVERLSANLQQLQRMQFTDDVVHQKLSAFVEIARMEESFAAMYVSLKEFKEYLPDAVLKRAEGGGDEKWDIDEGSDGSSTETESTFNRETSEQNNQRHAPSTPQKSLAAFHLVRRKAVASVAVGCRDFGDWVWSGPDATVVTVCMVNWLSAVTDGVGEFHGVVEQFHGDVVDISFGGLDKECPQPASKAAEYALQLRERLHRGGGTAHLIERATDDSVTFTAAEYEQLEPVVGIATSPALTGRVGCEGFKQAAVIGRAALQSRAMMGCAKELSLDVIINQRHAEHVEKDFRTVPVDIVRFQPNARKQLIFYLEERVYLKGKGDWMFGSLSRRNHGLYRQAWQLLEHFDHPTAPSASVLTMANVLTAFENAAAADPLARLVHSNLAAYAEEHEQYTGHPPADYSKLYQGASTRPHLTSVRKLQSTRQRYMSFLAKSSGTGPAIHGHLSGLSKTDSSQEHSSGTPSTLGLRSTSKGSAGRGGAHGTPASIKASPDPGPRPSHEAQPRGDASKEEPPPISPTKTYSSAPTSAAALPAKPTVSAGITAGAEVYVTI